MNYTNFLGFLGATASSRVFTKLIKPVVTDKDAYAIRAKVYENLPSLNGCHFRIVYERHETRLTMNYANLLGFLLRRPQRPVEYSQR
jgi:hypothetical protein